MESPHTAHAQDADLVMASINHWITNGTSYPEAGEK